MPRVELDFAEGFYVSQSGPLLEKRVVNYFPVIPEAAAATQRALFHTEGIKSFATVTGANSRGVLVFSDGTPYRVIGGTLYSFDSNANATNHGTISGSADVSMDSNGINIAIVDPDGNSYFFTPSTGTLELSNSAAFLSFGQAKTVTFKSGFYVYTTTSVFFVGSFKDTNDGKTFNALDFEDAEIDPDSIVSGFKDHNQLYIIGSKTTEVYRVIETSGFPFQRIPGAMIPKGAVAPNSIISFDKTFMFLGGGDNEKPGIYIAVGSSAEKISTSSIDQLIHKNSAEVIAKTRAFAFAQNGYYFAVFTIGNNTFVYDRVTSKLSGKPEWHERQTGITNGTGFQRWRAVHGAKSFGVIQVGDDRSARVGTLDTNTYTEYGDEIDKFWTTRPFINKLDKLFSSKIELFMRTGEGLTGEDDPQMRMDYSDNGSRSFKSEISKSIGDTGEYDIDVVWKRLGSIPHTRVMRFKTTAAIPVDIYGMFGNAEASESG